MTIRDASHRGMGDPSMLERIDALFSCGAGEHVDIPQIIAVGDQSSGKSSVVSGLLRKHLPRDSGLCTRFATKIVFRRAAEKGVRIFVIPDENASSEHRAQVDGIGEYKFETFDDVDFEEILSEVQEAIGIAGPKEDNSTKPTFSGDILQLEISGPNEEHLSVIDVPGIFRDHTVGLTTKEDIKFVKEMVLKYMGNPRSVMLAVVPSNVDVATQEILQLANDVDPEGDRTLGVLTKPDLVDRGAEHRILDLVNGNARPMKLGWHILRNPGQHDLDSGRSDRQQQEDEFFRSTPWNRLDDESTGIESLRSRLRDILSGLVSKEFLNVKDEVQGKRDVTERKLKTLGPERKSRIAKASFLTELATKFQQLVDSALTIKFGTSDVFEENPELKIAPAIVKRMEQFKDDMMQWGHEYVFENHEKTVKSSANPTTVLQLRKNTPHLSGLGDLLSTPRTIRHEKTEPGIYEWLRQLHAENRGFELGVFDPIINTVAMRKQTTKWREISSGFISDIIVIIHGFIKTAISVLCQNERLERELCNIVLEEAKKRYRRAVDQLHFIHTVELDGIPMTQDPHFLGRLERTREQRYCEPLQAAAQNDPQLGTIIRLDQLSIKSTKSNKDHDVRNIHDILHAYYDVARTRFVDNVCKQAADWYLINGPETPLRVLSPLFVSLLPDEKLEQIAGEEPKVRKQRDKLQKDMNSLSEAMEILS